MTGDVAGEYVLLECGSLTCGGLQVDHPIGSAVASLWATGTLYEDISVYSFQPIFRPDTRQNMTEQNKTEAEIHNKSKVRGIQMMLVVQVVHGG